MADSYNNMNIPGGGDPQPMFQMSDPVSIYF
jgi:hypothetical protein